MFYEVLIGLIDNTAQRRNLNHPNLALMSKAQNGLNVKDNMQKWSCKNKTGS